MAQMGARMPSGRIHNIATICLTALSLSAGAISRQPAWFAISSGAFMGLFLSPDLDVDRGNISGKNIRTLTGRRSKARRFTGGLLAWSWHLIWKPYALIFRHRSFFSHFPVISTVIRLVYLAIWSFIPVLALAMYWPAAIEWLYGLVVLCGVYAFIGLCAADGLHWMMDR